MASVPTHPFMGIIVKAVFEGIDKGKRYVNKMMEVLETTGPHILTSLYEQYDNKESIYIIPDELVSPLSKNDVRMYLMNRELDEKTEAYFDEKLEKAIAVHYFLGGWL